ncbi:MAG: tetratricopeptide repeat protein [Anaerohalosphaeraceae bacterium]|nr:tetratricopeptide repeat protein [Anaerohalosphaeraceae bacterium]
MAKRINKKIAIIGSLVLAMLIASGILVILKMSKDPQKFLQDAETEMAMSEPDYEVARKAYGRAFAYAKDVNLKIDILFMLSDMYIEMGEWNKAAGCWRKITTFDTKNTEARLALLNYSYEVANSGIWNRWKDVESDASELIEKGTDTSGRMYRIKGRAIFEQVNSGQKTDEEVDITTAIETLQEAQQLEPTNVEVYKYLAAATALKGEILSGKGILGAMENAKEQGQKILETGIKNCPDQPQAYLNFYQSDINSARGNPEILPEVEAKLVELKNKFPSSPLPYNAISNLFMTNPKDIDKSMEAISKAQQLDDKNTSYALSAANIYYQNYAINKNVEDFDKAVDIASQALTYPDSVIDSGPRARIGFMNRFALHTFLANSYLWQVSDYDDKENNAVWADKAAVHIHEINQLLGSAEHSYSIMWKGRLTLARGDRDPAIKLLNTAYELMTASGTTQGDLQLGKLCYDMAKALENTNEIGAVNKFFQGAISNLAYYSRPEILLDFAEAVIKLRRWENAIQVLDFYEKTYPLNQRYEDIRLGVYLGSNMLDEAEKLLAERDANDAETINFQIALANRKAMETHRQMQKLTAEADPQQKQRIESELDNYKKQLTELIEKAMKNSVPLEQNIVLNQCREYVSQNDLAKAKSLCEKYLKNAPENKSLNTRAYKLMLDEPDPVNIPPERLSEITLQAIEQITEPISRELNLAGYYTRNKDIKNAVASYKAILKQEPDNLMAISGLFEIYSSQKDFKKAEDIIAKAQKYNVDTLNGEMFKARMAMQKEDYETALEKIDSCLEIKPVFSYGYLLRSQINTATSKYFDAVEDARKAMELNPTNGTIAKNLAFVMHQRNQSLGKNVTPEQISDTRRILQMAMATNPRDLELKSFYADYISSTKPEMAISIAQQIQQVAPTVENSMRLAHLATKLARGERNSKKKDLLLGIAEDACKKALAKDPSHQELLAMYSRLLISLNRAAEAEALLAGNDQMLWIFYLESGQTDLAKEKLLSLYEKTPKDVNTVRGLLLVSRSTKDNEGILKYSSQLVKINNSTDNIVLQIESLLDAGLTEEGQLKLESFREKNPDEPRTMFFQSWLLARQGKTEQALELTNKNIEIVSNNPRTWQLRGQLYSSMNNFDQALENFQKSKALSESADIRMDIAKTYFALGRIEEAISELKTTITNYNSQPARVLLEQLYQRTQRTRQLENFYKETLQQFPDDVLWYVRAANFALSQEDNNKAFQLFDKALQNSLKINSDSPSYTAVDGKMQALLADKKYEQLLTEAAKYLESPYASIAYARMANAKFQTGDKDTSIQYFRRALEKIDSNENTIIKILQEMDRIVGYEETVKYCDERLQKEPDSLAINLSLFNLHKMQGQYNKAITYIDKCIELAGDNERAELGSLMNKAGVLQLAYAKTSDKKYLAQAVKLYQSLLVKQPNNITVLNNVAYILAESGMDLKNAVKYAKQAYEAVPNDPSILDTYGYALLMNKDYEKADELFQTSIQQFDRRGLISAPSDVYEHIGMVKEKLNQKDESLKAYQRALEIGGENLSEEKQQNLKNAIERMSR